MAACLVPALALAVPVQARVLGVGAGQEFALPSQAARAARDGDVVEIRAGDYPGDVAVWRADRLTLRGVGGQARLDSRGAVAEGKAIWVIKGRDTTVEHLAFSGARARDRNGAGIRQEGANLVLRHCLFKDNETGLLAGANPASDILVEFCEFAGNGAGDGQSHNLYIGAIRRFTLRYSHSHHARVGHQVKSRAAENHILYNRLEDGEDGNSSYLVDLPAAGLAYLVGNELHQGRNAENGTLVAYGAEQALHVDNRLFLTHNTLVNDRRRGCRLLSARHADIPPQVFNNAFSGCPGDPAFTREQGNIALAPSDFADATRGVFLLNSASAAIDRGMDLSGRLPETARPVLEYRHPLGVMPRRIVAAPDGGAHEYGIGAR